MRPAKISFASDGSRLAAFDHHGELRVWTTVPDVREIYLATLPGAAELHFATSTRLLVLAGATLRAVALDPTGGAADVGDILDLTASDIHGDAVLVGTGSGSIAVLSSRLQVQGTLSVCRKRLREVRSIPGTDLFAFACQDPLAGIARYRAEQREIAVVDTFATRGLTLVSTDLVGRYVLLIDESLTAHVYDVATRLLSHYGNAGLPSHVSAPTPEFNYVLIGDINGTVRVWDAPSGDARLVLQAPDPTFGLAFTPDSRALVVAASNGVVRWISTDDGSVHELHGHRDVARSTRVAPDGSTVLSFSDDGTARIWRARDLTASRVFTEHASVIEDAEYIERGRRVVSVGDDGRLLAWSVDDDDEMSVLFKTAAGVPLTGVEVLAHNDQLVVKDAAGSVWAVSLRGGSRNIRVPDGAVVTMLRASLRGDYVATGTDTGVVTVYDTATWRVVKAVNTQGSVRQIQFDPQSRDLLVASEPGRAQLGHVQFVALRSQREIGWRDVAADARDVAYAPDGNIIALICSDGGTWLYTIDSDVWLFGQDHDAAGISGKVSPDGRLFASSDFGGAVVLRKITSARHRTFTHQSKGYK
jgi:WD40 repeat protein